MDAHVAEASGNTLLKAMFHNNRQNRAASLSLLRAS